MKSLPNILIVDDVNENLLYLEAIIMKLEANLIKAVSGRDALEKTRGIELALAIIDVRMPEMNGYELASQMNKERSEFKVPIIFLTAQNNDETQIFEGYLYGAVDYLFKPIRSHNLLSKINVFLDLFNQKQTVIRDAVLLKKSADELTRVNAALKKSEEKYRNVVELANDGICIVQDGIIKYLNRRLANMWSSTVEEIIDTPFSDYIDPICQREMADRYKQRIAGKDIQEYEITLIRKDGSKLYVEVNGTVIIHKGKQADMLIVRDITERKRVEQIIKVSEEKYRTILNASPDGILLVDLNGIISEVSEIGLELFGNCDRDDLVSKNILLFIPDDEQITINKIFEKTISEGLSQNNELKFRKKNHTLFAAEISSTLIQNPEGVPLSFMIIIRDISQRKKMETKQIHADRMANLGIMAAGIAHEINQPLNIISLVLDKILFEAAKTESIDIEFLKVKSDKIFENIVRIRNIIDHVRAFSRTRNDYVPTDFDINTSIENATSMILEQFKHLEIILDLQLEKRLPPIVGNTYEFEQVIINLLANAKDAVLDKKSKQEGFYEMKVGIRTYLKDQLLVVEVTDNGVGICHDDINNVMLPFYTTKEEGKGTGLGLSICYQIIKEMGGTIDITDEGINGTKVKVTMETKKKK
jgi:PAS domain S-box-containing protein